MARAKHREAKERFIGIPYRIAKSTPFAALSAHEVKFMIDLLTQYNGRNNGMLSPTYALMKERGWAKGTLYRTFASLEAKGFVVVTRQGWKQKGKPTLVAITWLEIHDCGIEYDDGVKPGPVPLSYWCQAPESWKHKPTRKPLKEAA